MNRPPDAFDLELLRLGAIDDPDRVEAIGAARDGPLQAEHRSQEAWAAWWAAHRPPLPEPVPRGRGPVWALVGAAAIACGLVLFALVRTLETPTPVRPMGAGLAVDVLPVRDGAPVLGRWSAQPGDALHLAWVVAASGFADVVVVGSDGQVSVLAAGLPVIAGGRAELPGRVVLDDDSDREWLVVSVGAERHSIEDAERAARGLLPDPRASASSERFVLDVTRVR